MGKRGPKTVEVDSVQVQRWKDCREQGTNDASAFRKQALANYEDPIERLAWLTGTEAPEIVIHEAIQDALDARFNWREIAEATGYGADNIRKLQTRYYRSRDPQRK